MSRGRISSLWKGLGHYAVRLQRALLMVLALLLLCTMGAGQAGAAEYDCGSCHGYKHHGDSPPGCSTCHDSPPQTASHLAHFSSGPLDDLIYGDTTKILDSTKHMFGCGICHPLDSAKHRDGTVQVELYNPDSPEGFIKKLNPPSAVYTPGPNVTTYPSKVAKYADFHYSDGTCNTIYCHSYNDWTTPRPEFTTQAACEANAYSFTWTDGACYGVENPWSEAQPDWPVPSNTVTIRHYRDRTWGGESLTCSGCHALPPYTTYKTNDGGAGDSHRHISKLWIGANWDTKHTNNMNYYWQYVPNPPLTCRTCHNDTVADPNTDAGRYGWVDAADAPWGFTYLGQRQGEVPIDDYTKHVNGQVDVAFDRVNPAIYHTVYELWGYAPYPPFFLENATYDPTTKTCSNVSCHLRQTEVTWGTPSREWVPDFTDFGGVECNRCHQYD